MGGDYAPFNVVMGSLEALSDFPSLKLILVGDKEQIEKIINESGKKSDGIEIVHTTEVITMHDSPTAAVKSKQDSSLVVGAKLVKEGKADAFVSAGNTGAMGVTSILNIGRIKGVARPTLTAPLPNVKDGFTFLADVGAFVDSKPQHLLGFAILSSIFVEGIYEIENPKIGLLNVGEEESKGYALTTETAKLLTESDLNFIGNVEGKDIFKGKADIVICDGFIGNILLKFAESIPGFISASIKNYYAKNFTNRMRMAPFSLPSLKKGFKESLSKADPDNVGGLPLLGVNGISIVGHGGSSILAIKNMILQAKRMHEKNIVNKIKEALS